MANLLLLTLGVLLGIQAGWWAKEVYKRLTDLQARFKDSKEYEAAGIVRPTVTQVQRIDLTSPTGGVRRPSPDQIILENMKERDAKLKQM